MDLANCPRCGRLYARNFKELCGNCIRDIEHEYDICKEYLRENKGATITELSEDTGVTVKQITVFIREGRISIENNPNMMYPCEVCGILIRTGNMCDGCRSRLTKDLASAAKGYEEDEQKVQGKGTYGALDKFRK